MGVAIVNEYYLALVCLERQLGVYYFREIEYLQHVIRAFVR